MVCPTVFEMMKFRLKLNNALFSSKFNYFGNVHRVSGNWEVTRKYFAKFLGDKNMLSIFLTQNCNQIDVFSLKTILLEIVFFCTHPLKCIHSSWRIAFSFFSTYIIDVYMSHTSKFVLIACTKDMHRHLLDWECASLTFHLFFGQGIGVGNARVSVCVCDMRHFVVSFLCIVCDLYCTNNLSLQNVFCGCGCRCRCKSDRV